jgi:hypothetical protein
MPLRRPGVGELIGTLGTPVATDEFRRALGQRCAEREEEIATGRRLVGTVLGATNRLFECGLRDHRLTLAAN